MKKLLLAGALLAFAFNSNAQIITSIAGNSFGCCFGLDSGSYAGDGAAATAAGLWWPSSIAFDASGNMYISDFYNNRVRKVSTSGIITTVAGNGFISYYPLHTGGYSGDGGPATSAELNHPTSVAVDGSGNLYIADQGNGRIRKVSTAGIITTFAGTGTGGALGDGGSATSANISPTAICFDGANNMYIADQSNSRIRKINTSGIISTVAGNGVTGFSGDGFAATAAQLYYPQGVAVDASGNIYIDDVSNNRIRKVNTAGIISTIAGVGTTGFSGDGGPAILAQLFLGTVSPGIAVDAAGNVYFSDGANYRIRKINTGGVISTIAGTGVPGYSGDGSVAISAQMKETQGIALNATGNLYIADMYNNVVRKINSVAPASVNNINDLHQSLELVPNPNNGLFKITLHSANDEMASLTLCNSIGQKIKEINIKTNETASIKLDVPSGIYFITATTDKERYFEKLIVE